MLRLLFFSLFFIHSSYALVCWDGTSNTQSVAVYPRNNYVCVRYNYCKGGWNGTTCSSGSYYIYTNLPVSAINNIGGAKEILSCSLDYCNALINPKLLCYYGPNISPLYREFGPDSKNCYAYKYYCTVANDYCLKSDIGSYRIAYDISNSTTCSDVSSNILVKCCNTALCNWFTPSLGSNASNINCITAMILVLLLLFIQY